MKTIFSILLIIMSLSIFSQENTSFRVFLKNGTTIEGTIAILKHTQYIKILVDNEYFKTCKYKDIVKIEHNSINKESKDVVYLKNREKISGRFVEILPNNLVKFIPSYSNDTIIIPIEDVKKLVHKTRRLSMREFSIKNGGEHYVGIGPGIGLSYGYLGWKAQYKYGGMFGVAEHVGVGLYPDIFTPAIGLWYNVGVKAYAFYWFYLDLSYGTVGRSYKKVYPYDNSSVEAVDYTGFTMMVGVDFFANEKTGINLAIGKVISPIFSESTSKTSPKYKTVFDVGLIIKIPIRKKEHK